MQNRPLTSLEPPPHVRLVRSGPRSACWVGLLLGIALCVNTSPAPAQPTNGDTPATSTLAAPPRIWLWGIGLRGCEMDGPLSSRVYDQLGTKTGQLRAWPIRRVNTTATDIKNHFPPACSGPEALVGTGCAQALSGWCKNIDGWLLGGRVSHVDDPKGGSNQATRIRLWLYDLNPKNPRRIVQDDYCQICNADTALVVASHARVLLTAAYAGQGWEPLAPGWLLNGKPTQPSYCAPRPLIVVPPRQSFLLLPEVPPAPTPTAAASSVVARPNEDKTDTNVIKGKVNSAATEPLSIAAELSGLRSALSSILYNVYHSQPNEQFYKPSEANPSRGSPGFSGPGIKVVLDPMFASSRKFTLWVWAPGAVDNRTFSFSCGNSKDGCAATLASAAHKSWLTQFLGQCFSDQCTQMQETTYRPEAACRDFPNPSCSVLPQPPANEQTETVAQQQVRQKQANWLLGALWGAAALPLVTAGALGIADLAGVTLPNSSEPDRPIHHGLQPAILATFGVGLVLTIPAAIATARIHTPSKTSSPDTARLPWLECPAPTQPSTQPFTPVETK